jgi:hypothetical protein
MNGFFLRTCASVVKCRLLFWLRLSRDRLFVVESLLTFGRGAPAYLNPRQGRFDKFAPVQLAHEAAIGEAGKLLDGSARIMRTSEL